MQSNYLIERIQKIQIEYKDLLQILLPKMRTISFQPALDEIILFWIKNIDVVRLFLEHEIANKNSYIFTAATFLDFDDQEQFPFVLLGNHHILDDPLYRYSEACNVMTETLVAKTLLEQIVQTAEDNVKIIQGCNNIIFVLPLRLLRHSPDKSIHLQMAEQAFISLFSGINSIEEYFKKCETFADIMKYARSDIGSIVLFPGSDDQTLPLENRYILAKEENSDMLDDSKSEAFNFFSLVYGHINQATSVIESCIEFECIPYIRYEIALHYILLLEDNLREIPLIAQIRFKMCVAHLIYFMFEKDKFNHMEFNRYIDLVNSMQFDKKVFESLSQSNITESTFKFHDAALVVEECLNELYSLAP